MKHNPTKHILMAVIAAAAVSFPTSSAAQTAIIPPYTETFDTQAAFDTYTVIDANGDGETWGYAQFSKYPRLKTDLPVQSDDWFITPAIHFDADKIYDLDFNAWCLSSSYPETLEVFVGTAPTVEGMTDMILAPVKFNNTELNGGKRVLEASFTVPSDGNYYIGFHCISRYRSYQVYIDDVHVSAGSPTSTPNVVTDFVVTPDVDGELTGVVSFKAPSVSIAGNAISELTKIEVSRDGTLVKTFDAPAPSVQLSFTDQPTAGLHTYTATAYNADGKGLKDTAEGYFGLAAPADPESITVVETSTLGEVLVTWTPVTKDINGKNLKEADVTYNLYNTEGKFKENLTGTSCTFQVVTEGQQFAFYGVTAQTAAGESADGAVSEQVPVGIPYALPYHESFADGSVNTILAMNSFGTDMSWLVQNSTTTEKLPQDNDNGFIMARGYEIGDHSRMFSGKIDLTSSQTPALVFYYYALKRCENTVTALVDDGTGWTEVKTFVAGPEEAWKKAFVNLSAYSGKIIQFAIEVKINTHYSTLIDNILLTDVNADDLALVGLDVPETVRMGQNAILSVRVENVGGNTAAAGVYKVNLYRNGVKVQTVDTTPAVEPGDIATVEFTENLAVTDSIDASYTAEIEYAADADNANNMSEPVVRKVKYPVYPYVTDFAVDGSSAQTAAFAWGEPTDDTMEFQPSTDTFDTYESFAINAAGDWTFADVDAMPTYGIQDDSFPNNYEPMAYINFNSSSYGETFEAHSGSNYMASFAAYDGRDADGNVKPGKNDDWMISPLLIGSAQTVTFYARSYTLFYGSETFEFLTSSGGNRPEDFTLVQAVDSVSNEWTRFSYDIPAGTKYFAIRCTSEDKFCFMVDDVTFIAESARKIMDELSLVGYNVYRDGKLITPEPVAEPTFVDAGYVEGTTCRYAVSVVYTLGESRLSEPVEYNSALGGIISVDTEAAPVEYFNLQGVRVDRPTQTGVYIRRQGSKATKVVIR